MIKNKLKILSNFNISNIENILIKKKFNIEKSFFENFYSQANKINSNYDVFIVNDIKGLINIDTDNGNFEELEKDLNIYISNIIELSKKSKNIIIFEFINDEAISKDFYNFQDYNINFKRKIDYINSKLKISLISIKNLIFINPICNFDTNEVYDSKMWYYIRNPYSMKFQLHISNIIENFYKKKIKNKKLIILDLDNTIWGNILGEVGYNKILIGSGDPISEAYRDIQLFFKNLKNQGIVLAISSKNFKKNVLEVFNKNKKMILQKEDFVMMEINWNSKSKNILNILKTLNLKSRDVAFIDDNHLERSEVKKIFPDMLVPDLPNNPIYYLEFLKKYNEFRFLKHSDEDKIRTEMYREEILRQKNKDYSRDLNSWKKRLKMQLKIENLNTNNIDRVNQLYLKTNQINFATSKNTNPKKIINIKNKLNFFIFSLSDSYGQSGIIGFIEALKNKNQIHINEFIMSCRVYGRDVEFSMLNFVIEKLIKKFNIYDLNIKFKKNNKNQLSTEIIKKYFKITDPKMSFNIKFKKNHNFKNNHIKIDNRYEF